jgi:putative hydrolase of the HAD superfamily
MGGLRAVLFDADGVIQRAPDYLHARLTEAIGRLPEERETCMSAVFAAEAPALTGAAAFETGLAIALRNLQARCDVATVLDCWRMIESEGPILALVERLRAHGVYCALASNQERNRARHMSESLGYGRVFDRECYSCDLGHTKPSRKFFTEVLRIARRDAHRTLFIDDRLENIEAASRCGFVAEQFVIWREDDPATALGQLLRKHGLPHTAS